MNVVKDLQSLIQLIHSRDEVIVFPIGAEGQQFLDFLRYSNFLHRVCCIATPQVEGGFAHRFTYEVPIIPFENLVHFRETALLIVVAPEQFYANLNEALTKFGFRLVVFIPSETQVQIKNDLQKMYSNGHVMMWFMNYFDKKITDFEYRIAEQNEISAVNTKAFAEYRNAFRDKEIVIIGGGPTLNYYNPVPNAINIGLNFAWKLENVSLDYLFAVDGFNKLYLELSKGYFKINQKVFIAKLLERSLNQNWIGAPEDPSPNSNVSRFIVGVSSLNQRIYQDICSYTVANFYGTVFSALHFALYTYPKRIFLAGFDTTPSMGKHFYDPENFNPPPVNYEVLTRMKVGYARMKMFAKRYYPETEIISINPVGLRGLFKDVYTEEYQSALAKEKQTSL